MLRVVPFQICAFYSVSLRWLKSLSVHFRFLRSDIREIDKICLGILEIQLNYESEVSKLIFVKITYEVIFGLFWFECGMSLYQKVRSQSYNYFQITSNPINGLEFSVFFC